MAKKVIVNGKVGSKSKKVIARSKTKNRIKVKEKSRIRLNKLFRHGYLVNEDTNDKLFFQYNPESFYTEHGANYEEIESPGAKYRKISYGGRSVEHLPLTLYFYGVKNVTGKKSSTQVEKFFECLTKPKKKQKQVIKGTNHFISPPICTVVLGDYVWETVVESVKITRSMFNKNLKTMMMQVDVNFTIIKR